MSAKNRQRASNGGTEKAPAPASAPQRQPNAWTRPLQNSRAPVPSRTARRVTAKSTPTKTNTGKVQNLKNVLRERFLVLAQNSVGQRVTVIRKDGTIFEGVFTTCSPFREFHPDKRNCYVVSGAKGKGVTEGSTMVLPCEEVAQVVIKSMRIEGSRTEELRTDVEISKGSNGNRNRGDLIAAGSAWTTPQVTSQNLKGNIGEWDQFRANEQLFSVHASFDEDIYTTPLDKSKIEQKQIDKAERIAREIESTTSTNIHVMEERGHKIQGSFDEEDMYSGVIKDVVWGKVNPKEEKDIPAKKNYAAVAAAAITNPKYAVKPKPTKNDAKTDPVVPTPPPTEPTIAKEPKVIEKAVDKPPKPSSLPTLTTPDVSETPAEPPSPKKPTEKEPTEKEPTPPEDKPPKKPSKLNANAKSFTFNPAAASFTPGATSITTPAEATPPGGPPPNSQYMPHPPHAGMIPIINTQVPMPSRYPYSTPPQHHHPQHLQMQQAPNEFESSSEQQPHAHPSQPQNTSIPYNMPPGVYYPMGMHPRGGMAGFHPSGIINAPHHFPIMPNPQYRMYPPQHQPPNVPQQLPPSFYQNQPPGVGGQYQGFVNHEDDHGFRPRGRGGGRGGRRNNRKNGRGGGRGYHERKPEDKERKEKEEPKTTNDAAAP